MRKPKPIHDRLAVAPDPPKKKPKNITAECDCHPARYQIRDEAEIAERRRIEEAHHDDRE